MKFFFKYLFLFSLFSLSVSFLFACFSYFEDTPAVQTEADACTEVKFLAVGDNIMYSGTFLDAAKNASGGERYNFRPIYSRVRSFIENADVAFFNQETPVSHSAPIASYPAFNSPIELTTSMSDVGFDVVNLSNNHMFDQGAKGLLESYENWKKAGLLPIGVTKAEDGAAVFLEKNGVRIAFLSYTYGTNMYEDTSPYGFRVPFFEEDAVAREIRKAKEIADFVIVSAHWGEENNECPSDQQKKLASIMAKSGADLIIGHHPHVLQPIEWLHDEDGRATLVAYSLGNFVHEQAYESNALGGMLSLSIVKSGDATTIKNVAFIPTVCHFTATFSPNEVLCLSDYSESLAKIHAVAAYYGHPFSKKGLLSRLHRTIAPVFFDKKICFFDCFC